MFDLDRLEEIWATITRNKMRSLLTAMGIFWGIFMLVIMAGAGLYLERMLKAQVGAFATNSAFFLTQTTSIPYKGFKSGRNLQFTSDDEAFIAQNLDGVQFVSGIIFGGSLSHSLGDKESKYNLIGHEPQYNKIEPQTMLYGRYINNIDIAQRRKVCSIGVEIYEALFPTGSNPLGQRINISNSYFTVVGVHSPSSEGIYVGGNPRRSTFIPFTTLQQLYNKGDKFDMMAVVAYDDVNMTNLEDDIKEIIANRHSVSPDDKKAMISFNIKEQFDIFNNLFFGLGLLTWIVGLGTLLAGVVGVSNIMLIVVRERTQEIGVRRALGARPSVIISQILSESFVLTVAAGITGLTSGVIVLSVADALLNADLPTGALPTSPQISFGVAMAATSVLIIGGLLAGIIPANRAMSIKPVDAIREE